MLSNLHERCAAARTGIAVPDFPAERIRAGANDASQQRQPRRRNAAVIALVALSLAGAAAAAELAQQTHVNFTKSGGFVIKSDGKSGSRLVHSDAEIREAASHLNFTPVLPMGLPPGTRPIRLFTSGNDLLAITYDLPGVDRRSHHVLWIFLANPDTFSNAPHKSWNRELATPKHMLRASWRSGAEQVIVVSNGLTASELATMKAAMGAEPSK